MGRDIIKLKLVPKLSWWGWAGLRCAGRFVCGRSCDDGRKARCRNCKIMIQIDKRKWYWLGNPFFNEELQRQSYIKSIGNAAAASYESLSSWGVPPKTPLRMLLSHNLFSFSFLAYLSQICPMRLLSLNILSNVLILKLETQQLQATKLFLLGGFPPKPP